MDKSSRIYIAGHTGMVGSAIVRALLARQHRNILMKKRADLDLRNGRDVLAYFREARPEYVFLAAARVGGIQANIAQPAEFLFDNLAIQLSVIEAARQTKVKKLLFLGSSCMYPRDCPQPMKEEYLLTGKPEPTNQAYAMAKIAGMEMCRAYRQQYGCNFITAIPCNVYGPGDHYEPGRAHVIPALIRKAHEAGGGVVTVWGSGWARREFMHVDDLADACLFLMEKYDGADPINVGTGTDISIASLTETILQVCQRLLILPVFDKSKPDGVAQKLLDVSRLTALGWTAKISLEDGLRRTIREYREAHDLVR